MADVQPGAVIPRQYIAFFDGTDKEKEEKAEKEDAGNECCS